MLLWRLARWKELSEVNTLWRALAKRDIIMEGDTDLRQLEKEIADRQLGWKQFYELIWRDHLIRRKEKKAFITCSCRNECLKEGQTRYLLDMNWWSQWKR